MVEVADEVVPAPAAAPALNGNGDGPGHSPVATEGSVPSTLAQVSEATRILEQDPRTAPRRREHSVSITIVRLPYEPQTVYCRSYTEFMEEMERDDGVDEEELFRYVAGVIPQSAFPRVGRMGGLDRYLEVRFGPGRYRCVWNSADLHTVDSEVREIPDLKAAARAREYEADREREAAMRKQDEARLAEYRAEEDRMLGAWARHWALDFVTRIGQHRGLGADAPALHAAVLGWLTEHARVFVHVERFRVVDQRRIVYDQKRRVVRDRFGRPVRRGPVYRVPTRPRVAWNESHPSIDAALAMFVPPCKEQTP